MHRYYVTILLLLLCFPNLVHSIYSEVYNIKIDEVSLKDPKKALQMAESDLRDAELQDDAIKRLIATFYIVESNLTLFDHKNAEKYIDYGLELAQKEQNIRFESEFIGFKSIIQEAKGEYEEALASANKAIFLAQKTDDDKLIAVQIGNRSIIYISLSNLDMALQDVQKALSIFKENNDRYFLSYYYNVLAIIYESLEDYDRAIKYYNESQLYNDLKEPQTQMALFHNLAIVYVKKNNHEQALTYFTQAIAAAKEFDNDHALAMIHYRMAESLVLQDNISRAEEILLPLPAVLKENGDPLLLFNAYILLAEIKITDRLFGEALNYLNLAEEQQKALDTPNSLASFLKKKEKYFFEQGMWEDAYQYKVKAEEVRKEIRKNEKEKLTSELKIKFNAQFDQEKLELLQKQNELQQESIQQEKTKQKYLWGILILGLFFLLVTYFAYRHQKKTKKHLYQLSTTDYLTKVANRRQIIGSLKKEFDRAKNRETYFLIIMIDLDNFKSINDVYGHDIGNEVLIYFANTAKNTVKKIGEVGRLGGEEWLILLPNIGLGIVKKILDGLRQKYQEADDPKIPPELKLTFSSGVIEFTEAYDDYEAMLRDVDQAMYQAKAHGRNQDVYV